MERIGSTSANLFGLTFGLCLIANLLFSEVTSDKHQLELAIGYVGQESYPLAIGVLSPLLRKNPSSFLVRWGIRAGEGEDPRGGAPPCMACVLASVSQWHLAREDMARGGGGQTAPRPPL